MKAVYLLLTVLFLITTKFPAKLDAQQVLNEDSYSISYPDDWTLDDSGAMGTKFLIFSPVEGIQDNFRENVNLVVEDVSGLNIDLKSYIEASVQQITSMITDAEIISIEVKKESYSLVFTGTQGIYNLKFEQLISMKDEKVFIVTFTAKQTDFDRYIEQARKITETFDLK